jgi:hypothetical protein
MSSLTGIARNRAWPSTGSWFCVIALTLNPVNSLPEQSICVLALCADSRTRQPTAVFLAAIWLPVFVASRCEEARHAPWELVNGRVVVAEIAFPPNRRPQFSVQASHSPSTTHRLSRQSLRQQRSAKLFHCVSPLWVKHVAIFERWLASCHERTRRRGE